MNTYREDGLSFYIFGKKRMAPLHLQEPLYSRQAVPIGEIPIHCLSYGIIFH